MSLSGPVHARSLVIVMLVLGLLIQPGDSLARRPHKEPCPFQRDPREALHTLKAIYQDSARYEQGEIHETFLRMSRDALSFFKGAFPVFCEDLNDPKRPWSSEPRGPQALLLGEAHVMNLGTLRDGRGTLVLDFVRLDQSGPGPILIDLRRLLVSLVLLADEIDADVTDIESVLQETLKTYKEGLSFFCCNRMAGEFALSGQRGNPYVRRMLKSASSRTRTQLLDRWTVSTSAGRRFRVDSALARVSVDLLDAFAASLARMNLPCQRDGRFFAVKDGIHRVFKKKGAQGHERVYLLVEGPSPDPDDDLILEASITASSVLGHYFGGSGACGGGQARQTIEAARKLRRCPEPYLGAVRIEQDEYLVQEVQPWLTHLSTEELTGLADLYDLARASGTLLARAHALTAVKPDALTAFVRGWEREANQLESSLIHFAVFYSDQVHLDHVAFKKHVAVKPLLVVPVTKRSRHHRRRAAGSATRAAPSSPEPSVEAPMGTVTPKVRPSPAGDKR
ncbi:MAG: DUF2252 family protein [Candidatus Riflebacteria bacterium]|nr:DUF2252 family protein [Candidatus Riflebacteria bacterium]